MKSKYPNIGRGWAWQCDFGVCHWVEPTKKALTDGRKPSPEAKAISVRIVPESTFRRQFGFRKGR